MRDNITRQVSDYYTSTLERFGETPQGVDWNGAAGQELRFVQLMKVVNTSGNYSINDVGCGFGSLLAYLDSSAKNIHYCGIDVSEKMIETAKLKYKETPNCRFICSNTPDKPADYSVASGIFNVKLDASANDWLDYIFDTLEQMDRYSRKGFAFNCLTSFSDKEKMKENLYYADPAVIFSHCKKNYARNVALLHDYDLYEFTIIVRKS